MTAYSVAPVTTFLLVVNIALYALCAWLSNDLGQIKPDVVFGLGMSVREGLWEGEWQRLIMPNFLHLNLMHIVLNMMALRSMGPAAEVHFGSANFGTLYLVSGVGGFCFSQLFRGYHAAGASAALFGLFGAELCVAVLKAPVLRYAWRNSQVRELTFWAALYLGLGFVGLLGPMDNWGHMGGLLVGALLAAFFELWRRRGNLSWPLLTGAVLSISLLVCATRWTIFSPYYHVHMGLIATEEHRPTDASEEFAAAERWAKVWHKEKVVRVMIAEARDGEWTRQMAKEQSYFRKAMFIRGEFR
ncbi:MAG TPA: rhomboid family intramembrane serine protease [Planctomycetota bacterium]